MLKCQLAESSWLLNISYVLLLAQRYMHCLTLDWQCFFLLELAVKQPKTSCMCGVNYPT